ncbi:hypothetical protein LINGRAPRIM_LOCUS2644, partial [Linum grandiflorum]
NSRPPFLRNLIALLHDFGGVITRERSPSTKLNGPQLPKGKIWAELEFGISMLLVRVFLRNKGGCFLMTTPP